MLIFPKAAVSSYKMANGNYIILVAQPSNLKENAEQALAYGRDKKSKEIFLQKILGSMRHVRAYKTSNGE
jgi:hypothetical protein